MIVASMAKNASMNVWIAPLATLAVDKMIVWLHELQFTILLSKKCFDVFCCLIAHNI